MHAAAMTHISAAPTSPLRTIKRVQTRSPQIVAHLQHKMKLVNLDTQEVLEGFVDESQYILEAAEALGADIPWVCKSGTCCSCAVRVKEGSVNYDDLFITTPRLDSLLSDEEIADGLVPSCRSKASSDIVLEFSPMGLH